MKKLNLYNGHWSIGKYKHHHLYIAAHSDKHAAELVSMALYGIDNKDCVRVHTIKTYFYKGCWGNPMKDIEATKPCVYAISEIPNQKEIKLIYHTDILRFNDIHTQMWIKDEIGRVGKVISCDNIENILVSFGKDDTNEYVNMEKEPLFRTDKTDYI